MISENHDLQATHEIFYILKESRSGVDLVLDQFPGVFATINQKGTVLRGNELLSELLAMDREHLLGKSLSQLFSSENWKYFIDKLHKFFKEKLKFIEFELSIEEPVEKNETSKKIKSYHWQIGSFYLNKNISNQYCNVIGKDISQLKMAMSSLVTAEKDLEIASTVQNYLLPKKSELKTNNFEIAAYYQPARQTGGDWWWIDVLPNGNLLLLIGDVTGHGPGAAMVMAAITGGFIALREAQNQVFDDQFVRRVLEVLNKNLYLICGGSYWMPFSVLEVIPDQHQYRWWNAGAPLSFLFRHSGEVEILSQASTPLGSEKLKIALKEGSFKKGDRFFLCTDGIYEFTQSNGKKFKKVILKNELETRKKLSVTECREDILKFMKTVLGEKSFEDDVTFILIDLF